MGRKPKAKRNISMYFLMDRQIHKENTYVERLQKLVPLEVTALYIFLSKIATGWEGLLGILLIVLVIALWPYLERFQNVQSSIQKVIIIVSFVLWISYTDPPLMAKLSERVPGGQFVTVYLDPIPLGMIVAVWTFLIPLFAPVLKKR